MNIRMLLPLMLILVFLGCDYKYEKVGPLYEKAEVVQLVYLPDTSSSNLAPGFDMKGKITFTIITTGHSEYHGVVFKCSKHQKNFTIKGKELFESVKVGQIVDVEYNEIHKVYDDGRRELTEIKTTNIFFKEK